MSVNCLIAGIVLLLMLSGCRVAQTDHPGVHTAPRTDGGSNSGIHWRIVGNFTPLSVNRVNHHWIGNSRELLAKGDISLMAQERHELTQLAGLAKSFARNNFNSTAVPVQVARLHLHYREVIDRYAYAANGHTRLTPLFDMTSVDQWREYSPADPYVPATGIPVVASVGQLRAPCDWRVGDRWFRNQCESIAFAASASPQRLTVSDANGVLREATVTAREITLLALGDADIAGEGVGHWHDVQCHRSTLSWPFLLAGRWAADNPGSQFNVISRACAGAGIAHLIDADYEGVERPQLTVGAKGIEVPARLRRAQLSAAIDDLCGHSQQHCEQRLQQPDYILISIGAADLGLYERITAALDNSLDSDVRYRQAAFETLLDDYRRLARELRQHFANSKVIMTGFLDPLHSDRDQLCSDGSAALQAHERDSNWSAAVMGAIAAWRPREDEKMRDLQKQLVRPALAAIDQIGATLERENTGYWFYVPTAAYDDNGNQQPEYKVRGFCARGTDLQGAWFDRIVASEPSRNIVASNLFAQLYLAGKVHAKICTIDETLGCD